MFLKSTIYNNEESPLAGIEKPVTERSIKPLFLN